MKYGFGHRCRVPRCPEPPFRWGLCRMHYWRWYRIGDPGTAESTYGTVGCAIDGCDRPHRAHGYCAVCLRAKYDPATMCKRRLCHKPILNRKRRLCHGHYQQYRKVVGMVETLRRRAEWTR